MAPLPCPTGTAPSKNVSSGWGRLEWKALSRVGQREIDVHGVIRETPRLLRLIEDAGTSKRRHVAVDGLDVPADPARHLKRIDDAPWPVMAVRKSANASCRVFQEQVTESNEICAPCSSPQNAAAARRETCSREAIERVTIVIPVSIDRRPARNQVEARRRPFAFRADER